MQAAAALGVRHGPINLNFFPTANLGPEHDVHHSNQTEAIADYVTAHGGNLPTGRLQLVPVADGFGGGGGTCTVRAIESKNTTVLPFHLVFERRGRRAAAAQKVCIVEVIVKCLCFFLSSTRSFFSGPTNVNCAM